jgi:hypothetical protein
MRSVQPSPNTALLTARLKQVDGPQFCAILLNQQAIIVAQLTRRPSIASVHGLMTQDVGSFDSKVTAQPMNLLSELLRNPQAATEVTKLVSLQSEGSKNIAYSPRFQCV